MAKISRYNTSYYTKYVLYAIPAETARIVPPCERGICSMGARNIFAPAVLTVLETEGLGAQLAGFQETGAKSSAEFPKAGF